MSGVPWERERYAHALFCVCAYSLFSSIFTCISLRVIFFDFNVDIAHARFWGVRMVRMYVHIIAKHGVWSQKCTIIGLKHRRIA
jgi:hypothetical protein